jgi:huntingtin
MSTSEYQSRKQYLLEMLDLPSEKRIVKTLSGGQQRRVSLAVALLHNPELLILDEPTVGVDPMLRARIWDYLRDITQKTGVTVIITTHYIEEARYGWRFYASLLYSTDIVVVAEVLIALD